MGYVSSLEGILTGGLESPVTYVDAAPTRQGRYFVALSLEEAEHLRGALQGDLRISGAANDPRFLVPPKTSFGSKKVTFPTMIHLDDMRFFCCSDRV